MGTILTLNPQNGLVTRHSALDTLAVALNMIPPEIPVREDQTPYQVTPFMGGVLFDGLPLNVILNGVWYQGQQEALQPEWAAGRVAMPAAQYMGLPIVPLPDQFQPAASSNLMTYAIVGLGLLWLLKR